MIAKKYGVRVYLSHFFDPHRDCEITVDGCVWKVCLGTDTRGLVQREISKVSSSGPIAHACSPRTKTVWFDNLYEDQAETHLHEVVHVIVDPPKGIDQLSEDVILLPFERILAKRFFSKKAFERVLKWQEYGTQIEWWNAKKDKYHDHLGGIPNYTRWFYWRQSMKALRDIGLIKDGKPTWKYPNWKKADPELMERGNFD